MKRQWLQFALLGSAGILAIVSASAWAGYMGNGIAYGSLVGLHGREQDLALFGSRAIRFLEIALCSEALAVMAVAWVCASASRPVWLRLCIALGLAAGANAFTYAAVRGL